MVIPLIIVIIIVSIWCNCEYNSVDDETVARHLIFSLILFLFSENLSINILLFAFVYEKINRIEYSVTSSDFENVYTIQIGLNETFSLWYIYAIISVMLILRSD